MTFGQRLREARLKAQISQADLTRLSGVPKTMLSRYENDHILPSISTLHKLSVALGTGEAALLGDIDVSHAFEGELGRRGITLEGTEAVDLANLIADMIDEHDVRVGFIGSAHERRA